jgi:hypothetical protein
MKWRNPKKPGAIFQYPTKDLDIQTVAVLSGCFALGATRFKNAAIKFLAHSLIERLKIRVDGTLEPPLEVRFANFSDADVAELELAAYSTAVSLSSTPAAVRVLSAIGGAAGEEIRRRTGENSPVVDQLH